MPRACPTPTNGTPPQYSHSEGDACATNHFQSCARGLAGTCYRGWSTFDACPFDGDALGPRFWSRALHMEEFQ